MTTAPVTPNSKPWYKSKTVWVNVIVMIVGVLTILQTSQTLVPSTWLPYFALVVGILNVVLRVWFTDTAIS